MIGDWWIYNLELLLLYDIRDESQPSISYLGSNLCIISISSVYIDYKRSKMRAFYHSKGLFHDPTVLCLHSY